ncbi:MAG: DUF480 domain-containing protein [Gemmataceae bacterium]
MSSETPPEQPTLETNWPLLDQFERRVIGVLVEKSKTTPDSYPMTMNAIISGCNQKSNRDPQMNMDDIDTENALLNLKEKKLTTKIVGVGRTDKWRHNVYEEWEVGKFELAVLCELLLRGPQTEGELRTRASRMNKIEDLDALRAILDKLETRKMVLYLTPKGRRGTVVTHLFYSEGELEFVKAHFESKLDSPSPSPSRSSSPGGVQLTALETTHAELRERLDDLEKENTHLSEKMNSLEKNSHKANAEATLLRDKVQALETELANLREEFLGLKKELGG